MRYFGQGLIAVVLAGFAPDARGNVCLEAGTGYDWDSTPHGEIRVYIHPNLAENLEHTEGVAWNQAELREAIESALLSFRRGGGCCQLLNWVHLGFNGTSFTRGNTMQQGISLYGPPHVAYKGPSSSPVAFLLAHRNVNNEYFYTIGKTTSETALWNVSTLTSHASGSGSYTFSPSVGAAGGAYELVEQSR